MVMAHSTIPLLYPPRWHGLVRDLSVGQLFSSLEQSLVLLLGLDECLFEEVGIFQWC